MNYIDEIAEQIGKRYIMDMNCNEERRLDPGRALVAYEYYLSLRRAGANFITSYLATEMAAWMHEQQLVSD